MQVCDFKLDFFRIGSWIFMGRKHIELFPIFYLHKSTNHLEKQSSEEIWRGPCSLVPIANWLCVIFRMHSSESRRPGSYFTHFVMRNCLLVLFTVSGIGRNERDGSLWSGSRDFSKQNGVLMSLSSRLLGYIELWREFEVSKTLSMIWIRAPLPAAVLEKYPDVEAICRSISRSLRLGVIVACQRALKSIRNFRMVASYW